MNTDELKTQAVGLLGLAEHALAMACPTRKDNDLQRAIRPTIEFLNSEARAAFCKMHIYLHRNDPASAKTFFVSLESNAHGAIETAKDHFKQKAIFDISHI